ncbi:MAG: type III-B CRISPR module-associated protein Cmr5, partial [Chthoniobacterales bacterium]
MKNLAQIRAASALAFAFSNSPAEKRGKDGGEAIKKIPPMIAGNGLLAAIAFSIEKKINRQTHQLEFQRPGYAAIFDAIAGHLASEEISIIPSEDAQDL